ncbi:hypothetical protein M426DRAFT_105677 [Hypoxylon sp. CI-4A]|nr:hypothetical protein M426DRAFT_105677 [Hypoxylon sp. CI-4A]
MHCSATPYVSALIGLPSSQRFYTTPTSDGKVRPTQRLRVYFRDQAADLVTEAKLDTHDVALPIPTASGQAQRVLRAMLLSSSDIGTDECRKRIQRLYHLNGGQDAVILFLLKQEQGQASPMATFMKLQLELSEFEIPLIPVNAVEDVAPVLKAFHGQVGANNGPRRVANPAQTLLPYCSDNPPLPQHAVNILTDVTSDVRGLLETMSSAYGQKKIVDFLGNESENAISFWAKEYVVD